MKASDRPLPLPVRDNWIRGFVCATVTHWRQHGSTTTTRDLLGCVAPQDIERHADAADVAALRRAGFLQAQQAFTLLEIIVSATILMLLVGLLLPPALSAYITRQQIAREDAALAAIAADIRASFDRPSFNLNVSAISGQIDGGTQPTLFSTSTSPAYLSITGREWFAKVALLRGVSVSAGSPVTKTSQPAVYNIAYNAVGQPRLLFLDPTVDSTKQRYILCSLIAPNSDLILPDYAATPAWFNALFDTPWERSDITIPSLWTTLLSGAQQSRWNSDTPGKSRTPRLRYVQIVQPKHDLTINALHPTDGVWLTWNNGQFSQVPIAPGSGANTVGPILEGRRVDVAVGQTYATAIHAVIPIREFAAYTAQ